MLTALVEYPSHSFNLSYAQLSVANSSLRKRNFLQALRALSREYKEKEIAEVMKSTEVDYKYFWKALKKKRKSSSISVLSITSPDGKVRHNIDGVLQVWHDHFSALCTPKDKDTFDKTHLIEVSKWVKKKAVLKDIDEFTEEAFTISKMMDAIKQTT